MLKERVLGVSQESETIAELRCWNCTICFAVACNDSWKIIEQLQSRCAIVRFTKLNDEEVLERLKFVMDRENIDHTLDGYEALIFTADGDMRYALYNLQVTSGGFGLVNKDNVFKVATSLIQI
jgi:replication factor C subunit 2/4